MSNNKQSSVEWFFEQLVLNKIIIWNQTKYNVKYKYEIFLGEAKAMHKEEHKSTYIEGFTDGVPNFEKYYNETFNK